MKSKCRSCEICRELLINTSHHIIVDIGMFCPVCKTASPSIIHNEVEFYGSSYECSACDHYILYSGPDGKIYKDEIYFDENYFLSRNIENNKSSFYHQHHYDEYQEIYSVDHIIQFTDTKCLFDTLKKLVIFS